MKPTPKTSYLESSKQLATKANAALFKGASADWTAAKEAAAEAGKLEIVAINRIRSCGMKLKEAAGHEKPSFEFYRSASAQLPKDMSFPGMRFCFSLTRNSGQANQDP